MIISRRDLVVFIFPFSVVVVCVCITLVQALLFILKIWYWGCSCSRFDGSFRTISNPNSCVLKYLSFSLFLSPFALSHIHSLPVFISILGISIFGSIVYDSDHSVILASASPNLKCSRRHCHQRPPTIYKVIHDFGQPKKRIFNACLIIKSYNKISIPVCWSQIVVTSEHTS